MATSEQVIWILLLAASVLLCVDSVHQPTTRGDPRFTVVACGLLGLACLTLVAICPSAG
jgi:hypothetical protein